MATRTLTIAADQTISPTADAGYGSATYIRVGRDNFSRTWRSLLKFNLDWTDVASITSAVLHVRAFDSPDFPPGSSPNQTIKRVTSAWTEGVVVWATQPSTTTSGQVAGDMGAVANAWYAEDITTIVRAWAPATVAGGGAATNYGIMFEEVSDLNADFSTYYARESSYGDPYITLTYVTNSAPTAPTAVNPTGGEGVASTQPVISFTHHDPDGDSSSAYELRVASFYSSPLGSDVFLTSPGFVAADGVTINAGGGALPVLTRGSVYYWTSRTKDATLWGPYHATQSFTVASLPTASVTSPVASSVAELYYTAGTNVNPRLKIRWSYSCPNGHAQSSVSVKIYADSAGSPGSLLSTEVVSGTATSLSSTYAVAADTKYHVSVTPTCSLGVVGNESTKKICRVRWGRASYYYDATSTPVGSISASSSTTVGSNAALVLEYAVSAGVGSEPTTWYSTVAAAGKNRYLWHRVTLMAWGASPVTPKLNDLTWSYSASGLTPDNWTLGAVASVDVGTYVYGTQSLKHSTTGAATNTYQVVNVLPNTNYILSGRIKTSGDPDARLRLTDPANPSVVLADVVAPGDTDWTRYSVAWASGSATSVRVECYTSGSASTFGWFDAIKFEASAVVTPWSPGFVGTAVTLDAGGMMVDAQAGGIFRLRGSAGTNDDVVTLGPNGLVGANLPKGWVPFAFPLGSAGFSEVNSASTSLAVVSAGNSGSILIPFLLPAPGRLQSVIVYNTDTASLRTAEWRLYIDRNDATSPQMDWINAADGTWSFTPTVASQRESNASGAPLLTWPGLVWLIIRNTSSAQTFGIGLGAAGLVGTNLTRTRTASPALGATNTAANYTANTNRAPLVMLKFRVSGEAGGY